MQIQSQFKDYYDSMQKFASYDVLPYKRNVVIEESNCILSKKKNVYLSLTKFAVGFCGKIYYGLYHKKLDENTRDKYSSFKDEEFSVYSYDDYKSYLIRPWPHSKEAINSYNQYFNVIEDDSIFIEKNTPIFISSTSGYGIKWICYHTMSRSKTFNKDERQYPILDFIPTLKMYDFEKVFTKELAYMNIESYINGVLAREHKNVPNMPNEVKIQSHGFDENSFRG